MEELEDQEPNDPGDLGAVAAGGNDLAADRPDIPHTVHGEDASQAIGQIPEWSPRLVIRFKFEKRLDDLVGCADLGRGEACNQICFTIVVNIPSFCTPFLVLAYTEQV